jgi:hypothetical protein
MPRNRTPISRPQRVRFSTTALAAFRRMKDQPEDSDEWRWCHSVLLEELKMRPWQFPCVRRPDPASTSIPDPHEPWSDAHAEALYRELAAALKQQQELAS